MDELKDLVLQSLDGNGTLDAIRAQLRSNVFKVVAGQKQGNRNESAKIMGAEFGLLALDLFAEFLELNEFGNTLPVFLQETQASEQRSYSQIENKFKVKKQPGKSLLAQIVQRANEIPSIPSIPSVPKKAEARVVKAEPIAEIPAFKPQRKEEKPQKGFDDLDFLTTGPPKRGSQQEEVKKQVETKKPEPFKQDSFDSFKEIKLEPFKDDKPKKVEPLKETPKTLEPIKDRPKALDPIKEKPKVLDPITTKPDVKESKPEPLPPLFSKSKPGLRLPSFEEDSNDAEKARLAKLDRDLAAIEAKEKAGKVVDLQMSDDYSEEFDE